jgi:peptide deformylase
MFEIAFGESKDRRRAVMVGLAAPQIGIQKRIILVDTAATGIFTESLQPPPPKMREFINPEILWKSEEVIYWREGCYSTGCICGIVPRSAKVLVRAYDRNGQIFTEEFEGYVARILQHEIDHLDGVRFPDRIEKREDLHWVEGSEVPLYRIHWAQWPKKADWSLWIQMKGPNA